MEIAIKSNDGVPIVAPRVRVDGQTGTEFEMQFPQTTARADRALVVDMAGLTYISRMGLRMPLIQAKELARRNVRTALCDLPKPIQDPFRSGGFDRALHVVETKADALSELAGPGRLPRLPYA